MVYEEEGETKEGIVLRRIREVKRMWSIKYEKISIFSHINDVLLIGCYSLN